MTEKQNIESTEIDKLLAYQELANHKTNHILHLILSLVTAGIWLIVWALVTASNTGERNKIRARYNLPLEDNSGGWLIKILAAVIIYSIFKAYWR